MPVLHVEVRNKKATYLRRDGSLICGNGDYSIQFTFDDEWNEVGEKTARFIWNGQYHDVDFEGDICVVPLIERTDSLSVGVYTDNLQTTTSATIPCLRSILCDAVPPSTENDESYANEAKEAADRAEEASNRAEAAATKAETLVAPPDWGANYGEEGYIKNRTHYTDEDGTVHKLDPNYIDADWIATSEVNKYTSVVIPRQKASDSSGMWSDLQMDIQPDVTYAVKINDEVFMCVAYGAGDGVRLGNNTSLSANEFPFCITWAGGSARGGFLFTNGSFGSSFYLEVMGQGSTVVEYNKMPEEFLPDCVVKSVNGEKPDASGNVTVATGSGGSASIDVTATVGQTIVVKEVDSNGKPTKWESADFQQRTHWTETAEIMPPTTITPFYYQALGVPMGTMVDFDIIVGNKYKVTFDGVEYVGTAFMGAMGGQTAPAFGNPAFGGGENTGQPFVIFKIPTDDHTTIVFLDMSPHTVRIEGDVVHKIPDEFVGGVYYIEATATWDGQASSSPTNYDFLNSVTDVMKAYSSGKEIKLRVRLMNNNHLCNAIYTMCGAGIDGVPIFMFVLPVSTYDNTHTHAMALIGGFSAALLIAPNADGSWGIYEY